MHRLPVLLLMLMPLAVPAQGIRLLDNWRAAEGTIYNSCWGYVAPDGGEYAIAGTLDSVHFFHIAGHRLERVAGFAGQFDRAVHREFKTIGHFAVAVAGENQDPTMVFDLQYLPDSVRLVGRFAEAGHRAHSLWADDSFVYLASNVLPEGAGEKEFAVTMLQLAQDGMPSIFAQMIPPAPGGIPLFLHVHDIHARGDTLWLSCGDQAGLQVMLREGVNFRPFTSLVGYAGAGYTHSAWPTDGGIVFISDENNGQTIKVYDYLELRNPTNPTPYLNRITTLHYLREDGSAPHYIYEHRGRLYIAYYQQGAVVFDVSDPANPRYLARYDTWPDNLPGETIREYNGC